MTQCVVCARTRVWRDCSGCPRNSVVTIPMSFIGSRGFLRRVLLVVGYPYDKIQKHSETYTNLRNHTIKFAVIQLLLFGYLGFRVWVGIPPGLLTVTTNRSTKKSTSKTAKKRVGSDHNLQFGSRINETLVASHLLRAEPRTPTPKP